MRVKILEGMALSRIVLTTKIGLEGIDAKDQSEVLLAEEPEDFVQQIQYCMEQSDKMLQIQRNARELIRSRYDRKQQAKKLLKSFLQLNEDKLAGLQK